MNKNMKINLSLIGFFTLLAWGMMQMTKEPQEKVTPQNTTQTEQTSQSSNVEKIKTLEDYVRSNNTFDDFEYNADYDVYIVSKDISSTFGDKSAIEFFNSDMRIVLDAGIKTDKPVIFRGWFENGGYTVAGSVVYFSIDNFNRDWKELNMLDTDTYKLSDGWVTASKFGQYQSSNNHFNSGVDENTLYDIFSLSK